MIATTSLYSLAALVVIATILPVWQTSRWWVRLCDFPRFQIALLAAGLIATLLVIGQPLSAADWGVLCALAFAVAWQLSWVWRYIPGAPKEVETMPASSGAACFSILTTNVLQDCRDADGLLAIVAQADPDLVFAVETDAWWCAQLHAGLSGRYPHSRGYPLANGYGMAVFSRLEIIDPTFRFLVDPSIPSLKTGLKLLSGDVVDLYGMHPQPPAPQQDSKQRDVELIVVAKEIRGTGRPSVVVGDLNDVAWSRTTTEFKLRGRLLDPRRGRGFFNTYPARLPGLRYPLDYLFHTPHFGIAAMQVLPAFKSDHLPLLVQLCLTRRTAGERSV